MRLGKRKDIGRQKSTLGPIVAKNIVTWRKCRHLSQLALANKIGCSVSFIGHIERGVREPSFYALDQFAGALGVSASTLVYEATLAGAELTCDAVPQAGGHCDEKRKSV